MWCRGLLVSACDIYMCMCFIQFFTTMVLWIVHNSSSSISFWTWPNAMCLCGNGRHMKVKNITLILILSLPAKQCQWTMLNHCQYQLGLMLWNKIIGSCICRESTVHQTFVLRGLRAQFMAVRFQEQTVHINIQLGMCHAIVRISVTVGWELFNCNK